MANSYTQIYIQLVFAVSRRQALIAPEWKAEMYKYATGIIQHYRHKLLAINGMPDHIHIFLRYYPCQTIPDLVNEIKTSTNKFIKEHRLCSLPFSWQNGYGAFSYHQKQVPAIIEYIQKQEEHHARTSFQQEYLRLLKQFDIDFEDQYLFDWK